MGVFLPSTKIKYSNASVHIVKYIKYISTHTYSCVLSAVPRKGTCPHCQEFWFSTHKYWFSTLGLPGVKSSLLSARQTEGCWPLCRSSLSFNGRRFPRNTSSIKRCFLHKVRSLLHGQQWVQEGLPSCTWDVRPVLCVNRCVTSRLLIMIVFYHLHFSRYVQI